jgi:hypothetical protein
MDDAPLSKRLQWLPVCQVQGRTVRVATGFRARLLGLAQLERGDVGDGLLVPRCASVHTFGMRFRLDIVFLDRRGHPLASRFAVPPRRIAWHRGAVAVLEVPSARGGESASARA